MKVLDLCCSSDHRFEGWFGSEEDYSTQSSKGLLSCPICDDVAVRRLPSAPRLNLTRPASAPAEAPAQAPPATLQVQAEWMRRMRRLIEHTEDVGERFASEARRIHYGDSEERAIRGQATREEAIALHDEGIEILSVALPAGLKEPLQ